MDVGGTFTRSVCAPTKCGVFVNSDSESRKGSDGCWRNCVVRTAEPDIEIDDLMERQNGRVKLHNLPRSAIGLSGEGQGHRLRHYALAALEGEVGTFKNGSA